jgi:uncharacterized protein (DUF1499 family)
MNTPNTHLMRYAVLLGFLLFFSCAGSPPDNLGVIDGQLAQVPSTPNAVSTQAPMDDKIHHIKPVPFKGTTEEFQKLVTEILESWEGATIVSAQGQYIYATFRSKIMGFVDDAEFYYNREEGQIHYRSVSRLGAGDLGVNRQRFEDFKEQFQERL